LFVTQAYADLFYLTEDRLIEGILVREDTSTVTFKLEGAGLWTLSRHSLHKMERESPGDYWLRIGGRQMDQNKLDKARESFKKAQNEQQTQSEAEKRLREIDLLEGTSVPQLQTPTPEHSAPVIAAASPERSAPEEPPLSEIAQERESAVEAAPAPETENLNPGPDKKVEIAEVGPSVPPPVASRPLPSKPSAQSGFRKRVKQQSGMEKELSEVIRTHSQENGVDPILVKAVISVESGWNPRARSSSGAQGLMQLMPQTAAHLGVSDPLDPVENIRGGVKYLGAMMREFADLAWPDRVTQALASYNAGLGTIREVGDYRKIPKTRRYIEKVMKAYEEIRNRKDSEFAYLGRDPSF
jgi:soluble lytic murein transglycosylase-like protein